MAGRLTVDGAQAVLTSFFSKATTPVPNFYLALIRNIAPSIYLSGSELDEPEGMGYQRATIPNTNDAWNNKSQPYMVTTDDAAEFIQATGDWGQIRYWALCNAQYDGLVYIVGEMEQQLYISNGDKVVIPAGALSVTMGPLFNEES